YIRLRRRALSVPVILPPVRDTEIPGVTSRMKSSRPLGSASTLSVHVSSVSSVGVTRTDCAAARPGNARTVTASAPKTERPRRRAASGRRGILFLPLTISVSIAVIAADRAFTRFVEHHQSNRTIVDRCQRLANVPMRGLLRLDHKHDLPHVG